MPQRKKAPARKKIVEVVETVPARRRSTAVRKTAPNAIIVAEPERPFAKIERGIGHGLGSMAGTALGGFIGGPFGAKIGQFLGGKLGHLVQTVAGFGDYKVEHNTVLSGGMPVPQIVNSVNSGGVIVRHREYLGDINATTAFTLQTYYVNPGVATTFPWLSQIAGAFEQYKLRGMLFEFKSTSSDSILSSSTSSALGSVSMATDYDVLDPNPQDKRTILNMEFSTSSKPSCDQIHPIECKKSLTPVGELYVRNTLAYPPNSDARLYDFCKVYIATEGMQAASGTCGELWCTYEIELLKQQYQYNGQADHFIGSSVTNSSPFGIVQSNVAKGGTIGGLISGDGVSYSFPPLYGSGLFLGYWVARGAGSGATWTPPNITFTNCSAINYLVNDTAGVIAVPPSTINAPEVSMCFTFKINQQGAYFTFGTMVGPIAPETMDLWVIRLPDSLTG